MKNNLILKLYLKQNQQVQTMKRKIKTSKKMILKISFKEILKGQKFRESKDSECTAAQTAKKIKV